MRDAMTLLVFGVAFAVGCRGRVAPSESVADTARDADATDVALADGAPSETGLDPSSDSAAADARGDGADGGTLVTTGLGSVFDVALSPSHAFVTATPSPSGSESNLIRLDLTSGAREKLRAGGGFSRGVWVDGDTVVWATTAVGVEFAKLSDGSTFTLLTEIPTFSAGGSSWFYEVYRSPSARNIVSRPKGGGATTIWVESAPGHDQLTSVGDGLAMNTAEGVTFVPPGGVPKVLVPSRALAPAATGHTGSDDALYWFDSGSGVVCETKLASGSTRTVAALERRVHRMVKQGARLYLTLPPTTTGKLDGAVVAVDIVSGTVLPVASGLSSAWGVAATSSLVAWTVPSDGALHRAPAPP